MNRSLPTNATPGQTLRICPLSLVGFVRVDGTDAEDFLHGQLSQDLRALSPNNAPLAAWHSAAGRVRAIFRVLRMDDGWLLVTERDLVAGVTTDLQQYVLRADVSLRDASDRWQAAALLGDSDRWLEQHQIELGADAGQRVTVDGLTWLRLGPRLLHAIGPASRIDELAGELPLGTSDDVSLAEIALGLPRLTPELQDRFIPQMLNLDLLGALDENKGCYPGQEIIARTQNLGAVKRRMLRFSGDFNSIPEAGTVIRDEAGTVVGDIIRSSEATQSREILAVTRLDSLDGKLISEAEPNVALQREPLPYEA